jgi:hypothetical protein
MGWDGIGAAAAAAIAAATASSERCKTYSYSYNPYRHASRTCERRRELVVAWSDSRQPEKGWDEKE